MPGVSIDEFLNKHQIEFKLHEHPAVYTTEDAIVHTSHIPGLDCKNLLVKDQKDKRFFLLILPASEKADLKEFASKVGEKRLSFANSKNLVDLLGLEPGSVSPFGLINDQDKIVELYIHKKIFDAAIIKFHPNRNTASLEISNAMFRKYLAIIGHEVQIIA